MQRPIPITEPSYDSLRYLLPHRKDMTFIFGARCSDGVIMVGDRRISSSDGSYRGLGDKIFHDVDGVVWGAAGALNYFNSFKERVKVAIVDRGGKIPARHFLPLVEGVHGDLIRNYGPYFINQFEILIAARTGAKSELYIVSGIGGHSNVAEYQTIGSGSPYAELFLKKLWKRNMGMKKVAEVGYFLIKMVEKFELEATVGVESGHPQVWFLPDNPQAPSSSYGNDASIRSANAIELDQMAESVKRKLDLFDSGFETFLNRS